MKTLHPLAIVAPRIGTRSETFIRRHVQQLFPGRTAAIVEYSRDSGRSDWEFQGPLLDLPRNRSRLGNRVLRVLRSRLPLLPRLDREVREHFLRQHGVRVLLGEYLNLAHAWIDVAAATGARLYAHAHGYDISMLLRDPVWQHNYRDYNRAAGVITPSEVSKRKLCSLGIRPELIHVIPYGVDVPENLPSRPTSNVTRCVAIGRMVAKKAPILVLDAFRRASEKNPNLHLDYVGDGPLFAAAEQFVDAFRLHDRVILHGGRPNEFVQGLLQQAHVFVQHSVTDRETGDEEGLPVAILESMAQGLAIVSTLHAGIPEAIEDGVTGFLVNEGDTIAMAERISALASDAALRSRLGQAAWETARAKFTWDQERASLLHLLGLE